MVYAQIRIDYSFVEIGQNTEKSLGDIKNLRSFGIQWNNIS